MSSVHTLLILALSNAALSNPACSEIHEYQIRRLVYLGSACGMDRFEQVEAPPDVRRFAVSCRNVAAYPQGLHVLCTDADDDRSCVIETPAQRFDGLELLLPKSGSTQ